MAALVLPGEVIAVPDVGEALAAAGLGDAALEGVEGPFAIGLSRGLHPERPAEVDEMLLRRRPFFQAGVAPLGLEIPNRHASSRGSLPDTRSCG
ncbi:MAG: hypothetical protein R2849_20995 [Thermomicrobiales bacterium]